MDYTQERVATLHDFGDADPAAPVDRAAVVVPMTDRDAGGLAAERLFSSLSTIDPARVIVPVRAPPNRVPGVLDWLEGFDVSLDAIWCNGPTLESLLADHGLDGGAGKGRDVWLGMGVARDVDFVALHDADVVSHETRDLRKLLAPLADGFAVSKGYYARVENRKLYGRLFRLLYVPLVAALADAQDHPVLQYLGAFRYALAGELALTVDVARELRVPRRWGLEVGILGEAYREAGFPGTAQVDLGRYEHEHRAVSGPEGLSSMASGVARSVLRVVEEAGLAPDYDDLSERYRASATRYLAQYRADARFNDLEFDASAERGQVETYADAIREPTADDRLPAWSDCTLSPADLHEAVAADRDRVR